MKYAALCILLATEALAGEYAVFKTGFRLRADRHETTGSMVRLYAGQGFMEFSASQIAGFEAEDYVPPPQPATAPSSPKPALSPQELLEQAALRNGLPPKFVHSVAAVESGLRLDAVSPKGAVGLMQLMPQTAQALQKDPHNPEQNADGGAQYLRDLLFRYDGSVSKAVAAYNAGPAAVDRYHGVPPYPETMQYVEKVIRQYERK